MFSFLILLGLGGALIRHQYDGHRRMVDQLRRPSNPYRNHPHYGPPIIPSTRAYLGPRKK